MQPRPRPNNQFSKDAVHNPNIKNTPNPSVKPKKSYKPKKRLFTKSNILYSLTIIIVLSAVILNAINLLNKNSNILSGAQGGPVSGEQQVATEDNGQATTSLSDVDETEPKAENVRKYSVANDLPRFINIPSIGVNSKILRLGVNNNNEILTPKNIYDTGWYEGSSKPGEPGAVFINGHVSGPTKKGVFYNIKKLKPGDAVKLELGNADLIEYKVVHKEEVPVDQVNMNKVLRSYDIDKQGLNLMTCGGEFDKSSDSYKNRTIIYAVKI
jgi:LPXTG-site transpeptidase (sortase) family protein